MNNGIFSGFDRRSSSNNKLGYNPSGLIQYEAMANSMPKPLFTYNANIDGIYHTPPANDWRISGSRVSYLIDTTRARGNRQTGILTFDIDKSLSIFPIGVPAGAGGRATVDWGDGTVENFEIGGYSASGFLHYYNSHGIYVIQLSWNYGPPADGYTVYATSSRYDDMQGKCIGFLSFDSRATTLLRHIRFYDVCDFVPKQIPPSVTSLDSLFEGTRGFLNNVELWDTKNVTNMSNTFNGFPGAVPSLFNKDLSNWNVSNVTNMSSMFINTLIFNNGGYSGIANWDVSKVTNMSYMFGSTWRATVFNQPIGSWNVGNVTNMAGMFGSSDSQAGDNGGDRAFNQDISNWDVSKVTDMNRMFFGAIAFNNASSSGIGNWNTSSCTNMNSMFRTATSFNQNIGSWNISGVTNIGRMFWGASAFNNGSNSGINNWNTIAVTNMEGTFLSAAAFNQPIESWNTSNVTTMQRMFQSATSFNRPLGAWDVSKVTNMNSMFSNGCPMNQDLSNWNVSGVSDMGNMFYVGSPFNNGGASGIGNWNTSNATNMQNMFFSNGAFNQPIGSWNTGKVTNMAGMFQNAGAFNQDISLWNVSKVTTMNAMFQNAGAFQSSLSGWNLAGLNAITSLDNFMLNKTGANSYSTANYDNLLIGWNANKSSGVNGVANWRTDLRPNFGGAKYTAGGSAATARASLVTYGWTITDGGTA